VTGGDAERDASELKPVLSKRLCSRTRAWLSAVKIGAEPAMAYTDKG